MKKAIGSSHHPLLTPDTFTLRNLGIFLYSHLSSIIEAVIGQRANPMTRTGQRTIGLRIMVTKKLSLSKKLAHHSLILRVRIGYCFTVYPPNINLLIPILSLSIAFLKVRCSPLLYCLCSTLQIRQWYRGHTRGLLDGVVDVDSQSRKTLTNLPAEN